MARLLLVVGILLADAVMTAPAAARSASGTSTDCFVQLWTCYFNTDRPAGAPDCDEQFLECLRDASGGA